MENYSALKILPALARIVSPRAIGRKIKYFEKTHAIETEFQPEISDNTLNSEDESTSGSNGRKSFKG